jgi:hypothetical protein
MASQATDTAQPARTNAVDTAAAAGGRSPQTKTRLGSGPDALGARLSQRGIVRSVDAERDYGFRQHTVGTSRTSRAWQASRIAECQRGETE